MLRAEIVYITVPLCESEFTLDSHQTVCESQGFTSGQARIRTDTPCESCVNYV